MANDRKAAEDRDLNRDPLSGEPGAHPVGTGVGAALGGAAAGAAGAAIGAASGAVGGPIGAIVGAVAGAVGGGLAGKAVAEDIDPTAEEAYWRENHASRPYASKDATFETYAPAYRYGWESRSRYAGRQFDDVETELQTDWEKSNAKTGLRWERARLAARDAWQRIDSPSTTTPQI